MDAHGLAQSEGRISGSRDRLLLCWLVVAGLAELAFQVTPWLAAVPALLAMVVVPAVLGGSVAARARAALLLLTAAAVPLAPGVALVVVAIAAAVALSLPQRLAHGDGVADLRRDIERCRRTGAPAYVLSATVPEAEGVDARRIRHVFRLTDAVEVAHVDGAYRVSGVISDLEDFRPEGLRARLELELHEEIAMGWARFPENGMTLELLLERATADERSAAPVVPEPAHGPITAVRGFPELLATTGK